MADRQCYDNLFFHQIFLIGPLVRSRTLLTLRSYPFISSVHPPNWMYRNSEMARGQGERTKEDHKGAY